MKTSSGIRLPVRLAVVGLALALGGCQGTSTRSVAWDPSMAPLFAGDPGAPSDQGARGWTAEAEEQLMQRMGYADAVAVATVREVRRHDKYGTPRFVGLDFHLREVLHGSLDGELDERRVLRLSIEEQQEEALASTVEKIRQLPDTRFLVFIKRSPDGDGADRLRWAFYSPNRRLLARVRALYRDLHEKA